MLRITGKLGTHPDSELTVLVRADAATRLEAYVLLDLGLERAHDDHCRRRQRCLDVTPLVIQLEQKIPVFMERRCRRLQRLNGVGDGGDGLYVEFDRGSGSLRRCRCIGRNERDGIAELADQAVDQDRLVNHNRSRDVVGNVCGGQHRNHTGYLPGRLRLESQKTTVGYLGTNDSAIEHAGKGDVG